MEFAKLDVLRKKCCADDYAWFSYDITNQGGHKAFLAVKNDDLVEFSKTLNVNKHIYEILPSEQTLHPYFDLEMEGVTNHDELLKKFLDWISIMFKAEFSIQIEHVVLDSCRDSKLSYHVIIKNCLFSNMQDLKPFIHWLYDQCTHPEFQWLYQDKEQRKIFDKIPYGTNQNFRMINQSKRGKEYVLKGKYEIMDTFVRSKDGVLLNAEKYKSKKIASIVNSTCDGLTPKQTIYQEEFMEYIKYNLLNNVALSGTWEDWRNIGFALYSTFELAGLPLFVLFSKINAKKYNEKETLNLYKNLKAGKITFHTIRYWAKRADHKLFKRIFSLYIEKLEERFYCDNDNEASDAVMQLLDDRLIYANQQYFKVDNIWIHDLEKIKSALLVFVMNAPIFKQNEKGESTPYWKNYASADKIVKTILAKSSLSVADYEKFHTTTKYKFAFKNGVLDFRTKKLTPWDDVEDYYSVVQIQSDYIPSSAEMQKTIIDKVLEPLFGEKLPLALLFMARSLAGCVEDKNFATYLGSRNCGKGAIEVLLKGFGGYVGSFAVKNLMVQRASATESTSKDLYWLLELEFIRLALGQEIPLPETKMKLNSDLVKKICSGGDTQIARRNYDRKDTHFQVESSLFIIGNDPVSMGGDVLEHHLGFESAVQFKTQEFIDTVIETQGAICAKKFRVADPEIKTKCATSEWRMALIDVLMNAYTDKQITAEYENIEPSLMQVVMKDYELTNLEEDVVPLKEMEHYGRKIKEELKMVGIRCVKSNKRDDTRNKYVFVGIKLRSQLAM